jgi:putative acetyltransferase
MNWTSATGWSWATRRRDDDAGGALRRARARLRLGGIRLWRCGDLEAMQLMIRQFRDEDAPSLWRVYHSAIHGTAARDYSLEQIDAWAPASFDAEKWAARMRGINPFVAERNGEIVGYADVQPDGYIDHFFVAAVAARQGVGSRLMEEIHCTAEAQRLASLFAHVSITARPFFELWRFRVEREQTLVVSNVELKNFLMRKLLERPHDPPPD